MTSTFEKEEKQNSSSFLKEFLIIFALLIFSHLLTGNMAENEVGKLMLAKQFMFPDWLPNDWYLSQPQKYQALFQLVFGHSIAYLGFLATSILGRIIYYSLISFGLVLIARQIKLHLLSLFTAITLFLYSHQGMAIAGEWMVGSLETKGFAYGIVLIAIWLAMKQRYIWMIASLGIATSLHILVGGYATLTFLPWLAWSAYKKGLFRQEFIKKYLSTICLGTFIYLLTSIFATVTLFHSLSKTVTAPESMLQATYIYTFLRNSHHLAPFTWQKIRFLIIIIYLGIFGWCWHKTKEEFVFSVQKYPNNGTGIKSRLLLLELTVFSLIPLFGGFVAVFFDSEGALLQYYPFRFGSLMLALNSLLIAVYLIQKYIKTSRYIQGFKKYGFSLCLVTLALVHSLTLTSFTKQAINLLDFPIGIEQNNLESQDVFTWIKNNTAKEAIIISSPSHYIGFNWLTNRATIAKFKLVPPTEIQIFEWYERLNDLSGYPKDYVWQKTGFEMEEELHQDYQKLTTVQVKNLMEKYQAQYFFDYRKHNLDLPIAYENNGYRLYQSN
ncbi:DUF6798 domain-containing protein [[Limnothrix rosea] IAM M-220]|uniref:DUF6798 domain-containing protein n=1 Tax=[Limnothrix rosea] IAM M-220 TaxID=454133 RepID=UPI0011156606|nr:DUF6798 domain-containing protein [[Limnothrix rosea] IAM M-220]